MIESHVSPVNVVSITHSFPPSSFIAFFTLLLSFVFVLLFLLLSLFWFGMRCLFYFFPFFHRNESCWRSSTVFIPSFPFTPLLILTSTYISSRSASHLSLVFLTQNLLPLIICSQKNLKSLQVHLKEHHKEKGYWLKVFFYSFHVYINLLLNIDFRYDFQLFPYFVCYRHSHAITRRGIQRERKREDHIKYHRKRMRLTIKRGEEQTFLKQGCKHHAEMQRESMHASKGCRIPREKKERGTSWLKNLFWIVFLLQSKWGKGRKKERWCRCCREMHANLSQGNRSSSSSPDSSRYIMCEVKKEKSKPWAKIYVFRRK